MASKQSLQAREPFSRYWWAKARCCLVRVPRLLGYFEDPVWGFYISHHAWCKELEFLVQDSGAGI